MISNYWGQKNSGIFEMRGHHVAEIVDYKRHPEYFDIPDDKYIRTWNESFPDNIRPSEFILEYRRLMKHLIDNPDSEIRIVDGSDHICKKCPAESLYNSYKWSNISQAHLADKEWLGKVKGIQTREEPYTVREILNHAESQD